MSIGSQFLKPKNGIIVRDPATYEPLSEVGEWKTTEGASGKYWRRRLLSGDVFIFEDTIKKENYVTAKNIKIEEQKK